MRQRVDTSKCRPFYAELGRLGFKRDLDFTVNIPCCSYVKYDAEHNVKLELQLWTDGNHRVSHWKCDDDGRPCVMNTCPTDFSTIEEMHKAIERELTRDAREKIFFVVVFRALGNREPGYEAMYLVRETSAERAKRRLNLTRDHSEERMRVSSLREVFNMHELCVIEKFDDLVRIAEDES